MLGCSLVSFHFPWAILCPQAVRMKKDDDDDDEEEEGQLFGMTAAYFNSLFLSSDLTDFRFEAEWGEGRKEGRKARRKRFLYAGKRAERRRRRGARASAPPVGLFVCCLALGRCPPTRPLPPTSCLTHSLPSSPPPHPRDSRSCWTSRPRPSACVRRRPSSSRKKRVTCIVGCHGDHP